MNYVSPLISVIISAYNSEKYIRSCILSILNQTYPNFELIIFDDNSQDSTADIICEFSDERIVFIKNDTNLGLTKNLNRGIVISKGKYIARIDSDDVCEINRFQIQVNYLEKHRNVDVLGSNAYLIDSADRIVGKTKETISNKRIKNKLILSNPFIHPSVMMKASFAKEYLYNEDFRTCQDYELWSRACQRSTYHSIRKPLIFYRINNEGATRSAKQNINKRIDLLMPIIVKNFINIGKVVSEEQVYYLLSILFINKSCDKSLAWNIYRSAKDKTLDANLGQSMIRFFGPAFLIKKGYILPLLKHFFNYAFYLFGCFVVRFSFTAKRKLLRALTIV